MPPIQQTMANPLYLFFASRAGTAATVLRWVLAFVLLNDAYCQSRILADPSLSATLNSWILWDFGCWDNSWTGLVFKFLSGAALLVGLFTRLVSGLIFLLLTYFVLSPPLPDPRTLQMGLLSLALTLSLTLGGGGRFSLDRKISQYLLPNLG